MLSLENLLLAILFLRLLALDILFEKFIFLIFLYLEEMTFVSSLFLLVTYSWDFVNWYLNFLSKNIIKLKKFD